MSITIHADNVAELDAQLRFFGYVRKDAPVSVEVAPAASRAVEKSPTLAAPYGGGQQTNDPAPTRERGKPAPGKAKRTKEEIEEDKAADAADAARQQSAEDSGIQAENPEDVKPSISTGEERRAPGDPQDADDEAAETARNSDGVTTLDDVRAAMTGYLNVYGMPAAQEDCPKVMELALKRKAPKNDKGEEQPWRLSLLDGLSSDELKKVASGINEMAMKNPFKREPV